MQGFKTQLILNNKQTTLMKQHCGVSRHAWNWGLALCQERLKNKEKLPSAIDLHKLLVSEVKPHNQWYYEVSKNSPQQALANLITGYKNYFRDVKSGVVSKKQAIYVQKCKSKSRVIDYDFLKEIVIEDLNVSGMSKNHKLASAILDGGFYEFRRQLEYKTKWYGSVLTVCNRYYPSSKTCSNCGTIKKDLKLSDRVYKCQNCQLEIDRDLNASFNLNKLSVSYTALMPVDGFTNSFVLTDETQLKQEENVNFGLNVQDCISFS